MVYINCPNCGGRLMEGEDGSSVRIKCAKCGRLTGVRLDGGRVTLTPIETQREEKTQKLNKIC